MSDTDDLLTTLNEPQRAAVRTIDGPVLVLAGPGSGKTRVLTHRIAYMIGESQIDPFNIIAVTFTNKAAREMKERLERLLGGGRAAALTVGTFHSICVRFLRRDIVHLGRERDFAIYDSDDQLRLMKRVLRDLSLDEKKHPPRSILSTISRAKNEIIDVAEFARHARSHFDEVVTRCYERYQHLLRESNALDFDDLLMSVSQLFEYHPEVLEKYQERYRYLLADEYQDTNRVQYVLLRQLAAKRRNIFVVGDEDQSVYAFRGADIRNIRSFEKDYPDAKVVMLEQNYRSTQAILDVAQAVINRSAQRSRDKQLWTSNGAGTAVQLLEGYDQDEEGQLVASEIGRLVASGEYSYGDIAVMYRTNAQSRAVEEALIARGVRYTIVGGTRFYERKEVKDALAYLRLAHNPFDSISLSRVINWPGRGIGDRTLEDLERRSATGSVPVYVVLQMLGEADLPARPDLVAGIAPRTRASLIAFLSLLDELIAARETMTLGELIDLVLRRVEFQDALLREYGEEEGSDRWNNVLELRNAAETVVNLPRESQLATFLEDVALVSDVDQVDGQRDVVTCITLHQAKGLEYPVVFLVGLEEGLLPHSRSLDDREALDEERRLFYVGATRAKQRLYLMYAFKRVLYGRTAGASPSRFLADIPKELIKQLPKRGYTPVQQSDMFGSRSFAQRPSEPRQRPGASAQNVAPSRQRGTALPSGGAKFFAGQKVRHDTFGEGIVVSSKLVDGDEEVTVAFAAKGVKRLLASFANLQRVG